MAPNKFKQIESARILEHPLIKYLSPSIYLSLSLSLPLYLTMLLVLMLIWLKVTLSSARRSLLLYYSIIFPRCKLVWNFNHLPHLLPVSLSYFHFFHHLFSFFLWLSKGIFIASFNDNSNYWHIPCLTVSALLPPPWRS